MSSSNKLTSTDRDKIIQQQRALAARINLNKTKPPPPPPKPPPPPPRRAGTSKHNTIHGLLRTASSSTTSTSAASSFKPKSKSSMAALASSSSSKYDMHISTNANVGQKRKRNNSSTDIHTNNEIIDLTKSPPHKVTTTSSAVSTKRPTMRPTIRPHTSNPSTATSSATATSTTATSTKRPTIRPTTKRPTIRSHLPSSSTVEKTIIQSRLRVQQSIPHSSSSFKSTGTSASASTSTSTKGFASLLKSVGVDATSSQLQRKIKDINKDIGIHNEMYGHDENDENDTMNMETYFDNMREWDFLHDLNTERMNTLKISSNHNNNRPKHQKRNQRNRNNHNNDSDSEEGEVMTQHTKKKATRNKIEDQVQTSSSATNDDSLSSSSLNITIPDTFQSKKQYKNLWSPLCLAEARAQVLSDALSDVPSWSTRNSNGNRHNNNSNNHRRGRGGNNNNTDGLIPVVVSPHVKSLNNHSSNMTIILQPSAIKSSNSDGRLDHESFHTNRGPSFMSNDLVVLAITESIFLRAAKGQLDDNNNSSTASSLSSKKKILGFVGVVEFGRKSIERLPVKISKALWSQLSNGDKREREMVLLKLNANVTSMREYSALCQVGLCPLMPYLLCKKMTVAKDPFDALSEVLFSGDPSKSTSTNSHISGYDEKGALIKNMGGNEALGDGFAKYAKKKFNPSQLGAISAAATEYGQGGFTLIKGPPGTGKTTTLVALLNALHLRQMNQYNERVRKIIIDSSTISTGKRKMALAEAAKGKPRILVCAPSNNAIDNVIQKITQGGFIDGPGNRYNPAIIRIGSGQSATVNDVSLETMVRDLMDEAKDLSKIQIAIAGFKSELSKLQIDIYKLRQRLYAIATAAPYPLAKEWEIRFDDGCGAYFVNQRQKSTSLECPPPPEPGQEFSEAKSMPEYKIFSAKLVKLVNNFTKISSKIERYTLLRKGADAYNAGRSGQQSLETVRQQIETHILDSTHIVLTTLGTSGGRALEASEKFDIVVVDEAAQSVEPATLVALKLGSSHAILVGDPQQLPATIFSVSGRNTKYDRSLFQRLEEAGHEVHLLDTQYRMHPEISDFPRWIFYGGYLKDGSNVRNPNYGHPLSQQVLLKFPAFRPFSIFDLNSSEERGGTSLCNHTEASFALHLYLALKAETGEMLSQSKVAIITPYSQQVAVLRRTFSQHLGPDYERLVEVNTVDSFQGREANVVILSCVRAAGCKGIGFLSDVRRMNVALTRAKHFLFVIARCQSIVTNPYWDELVEHANEQRAIIPIYPRGRSEFPDLSSLQIYEPNSSDDEKVIV